MQADGREFDLTGPGAQGSLQKGIHDAMCIPQQRSDPVVGVPTRGSTRLHSFQGPS